MKNLLFRFGQKSSEASVFKSGQENLLPIIFLANTMRYAPQLIAALRSLSARFVRVPEKYVAKVRFLVTMNSPCTGGAVFGQSGWNEKSTSTKMFPSAALDSALQSPAHMKVSAEIGSPGNALLWWRKVSHAKIAVRMWQLIKGSIAASRRQRITCVRTAHATAKTGPHPAATAIVRTESMYSGT